MTSYPDKIYDALYASVSVLRELRTSIITDRDLQRAKRTLLTRHESDLKTNVYWLGLLTHLQNSKVGACARWRRLLPAATMSQNLMRMSAVPAAAGACCCQCWGGCCCSCGCADALACSHSGHPARCLILLRSIWLHTRPQHFSPPPPALPCSQPPATHITYPPASPITPPPPPTPAQVPYKNLECLRDLNAVYDAIRVEDIYHAASHFDFSDASIFTCIGTSGRSQPPVPEQISPVGGSRKILSAECCWCMV